MVNLKLLAAQILGMVVVFGGLLFGAAGTAGWLAGWIFLVLFFGFVVVLSGWLLRTNPALLTERMTGIGKQDQKTWDKALFAVLYVVFLAWMVVMPLDAVRFHWSTMPTALQVIGALLLFLSFYGLYRTFRENTYLSPAVRIQTDRGQTVISSGPYHYVRHPMYASAAVLLAGTSLLLGSWYGLLGALLMAVLISVRAVVEERTLRQELVGYDTYMHQVRYRLIPYVW